MADENGEAYPLIWKELYGRYKELIEVNKRFATDLRVAVVGQSDAGPHEVYSALFGEPVAAAEHNDWQVAATFRLDQVPGHGVVGGDGPEEQALALLREADAVVLATVWQRRPTEVERGLWSHAERLKRVRLVVAVGDEAPRDRDSEAWRVWELELCRQLNEPGLTALPLAARRSRHLVDVAKQLNDKLEAKFRLSFAAKLRHAAGRDALVQKMIHELARVAGFLGLNPIPFSDAVAITPVQVLLVCRIAAAFGRNVEVGWAREFLATCGVVTASGLGFRQLFRILLRGLGTPALPIKMALGGAMAFAGTELVGQAARLYFAADGKLTIQEAADRAKAVVKEWGTAADLRGDEDDDLAEAADE